MIQIYSGDTGYALRDLSGTEGVTYFKQPIRIQNTAKHR